MSLQDHISECILDMIHYCGQMKVIHFHAERNSDHAIIDEGRTEIANELDELVETFLGILVPMVGPVDAIKVDPKKPYYFKVIKSDKDILDFLMMIEKRLQMMLPKIQKDPKFAAMADSLMDISAEVSSMKYLINQH